METSQGFWVAVAWVFLRFGIPVLITSLIILFLSQIDASWKKEALSKRKQAGQMGVVPLMKCWVYNDCPPEKRGDCPAFRERYLPCWQLFRDEKDNLKESCLGCQVFRNAPVPLIDR